MCWHTGVCVCVCAHLPTALCEAPVNADGDETTFIHLSHWENRHFAPVAATPGALCSSPHNKHLQSMEKNNSNRRRVFGLECKISEIRKALLVNLD